jgi:Bacterial SH3 domain
MMKSNTALIVAGVVGLGAVGGITYGLTNRSPEPPAAVTPVTSSTPTVQPSASPTAAAPQPIAKASAPAPEVQSPNPAPVASAPAAPAGNADPTRKVESCTVTMVIVDDPNPPLNVRSTPSTAGAVVGQLKNGLMLSVTAEQSGWFKVSEPTGWISAQRTKNSCNQKVERVSFGKGGTSATVTDRFIGTGRHRYIFNAGKGQRMTVSRGDGPFPTLLTPSGSVLVASMPDENRPQWSGVLTQTGDYAMEVESNFKGYSYSFNVAIE